jgi:hypothetical protein
VNANPNQLNSDTDTLGDVCDPDDDNDLVSDGQDNCPVSANPNQSNWDFDALGDVCDDGDGDGFVDATEWHVGTGPTAQCGIDGWPVELYTDADSFNKITIQDITSFMAPVRRLDTNPGDQYYNARWDIVPDAGVLATDINITDIISIIVVRPPMLGGNPAWEATCPG